MSLQKDILLINPYGWLPGEGWTKYRTFSIAEYISKKNNKCTILISNVVHHTRQKRTCKTKQFGNLKIVVLKTILYKKNISVSRLIFDLIFGIKSIKYLFLNRNNIKLVILSEPSIFYSGLISIISRLNNIPICLDVIDLWPEHFNTIKAKNIYNKFFINIFSRVLYIQRRLIVHNAKIIIAVCESYRVKYNLLNDLNTAKIIKNIPIGIDLESFNDQAFSYNSIIIKKLISFKGDSRIFVYSGSYGDGYDLENLCFQIEILLANKALNCKFIFIGSGPLEDLIINLEKKWPGRVIFLGFMDAKLLPNIYSLCDIGICSYSRSSMVSLPLKFFDYTAAGLCILTNLELDLKKIINEEKIGLIYSNKKNQTFSDISSFLLNNLEILNYYKTSSKRVSVRYDSKNLLKTYYQTIKHLI